MKKNNKLGYWSKKYKTILSLSILGFVQLINASNNMLSESLVTSNELKSEEGTFNKFDEVIAASLSVSNTVQRFNDGITVELKLTNLSDHPLQMLKWFTPLNNRLDEDIFSITLNGEPVEYIGRHYKRGPIKESHLVTIAAGTSISADIDLSKSYDLSKTGSYQIKYVLQEFELYKKPFNLSPLSSSSESVMKSPTNSIKVERLASSELDIWVEGQSDVLYPSQITEINHQKVLYGEIAAGPGIDYSGSCSSDEETVITGAYENAINYSIESSGYLSGLSSPTPRFELWFGKGALSTASSNFRKILEALQTKTATVDCSCDDSGEDDGYYAYVYSNQPYKIYLCNLFWTGDSDDKALTMVHEMSHFNVVAGTNDFEYGESGIKALAKTSPEKALFNASTYEYFAWNTPFLE